MKHRYILLLLSFAIIASALLTFVDTVDICGTDESGCSIVKNSEYSNLLGIKTSLIGLFLLSSLFIITLIDQRKRKKSIENLLKFGLITGSIGALYFIYLQIFAIGAICKYCMVVDISLILATILFFSKVNK